MGLPPDTYAADTILVIDDEPQIRRVVRNALSDTARRVIEAGTAGEGVDLAAAEQPALIVLDLGLPDRDGLEVCVELRAFTQVPIIVLSARHSDREKEVVLDAGADDYMTKPFSTVELKARIRAHLRRPASPEARSRSDPAAHDSDGIGNRLPIRARRVRER